MSEMQKGNAGSRELILQDSIFKNEIKRLFALQGIEDIGYSRDGGWHAALHPLRPRKSLYLPEAS